MDVNIFLSEHSSIDLIQDSGHESYSVLESNELGAAHYLNFFTALAKPVVPLMVETLIPRQHSDITDSYIPRHTIGSLIGGVSISLILSVAHYLLNSLSSLNSFHLPSPQEIDYIITMVDGQESFNSSQGAGLIDIEPPIKLERESDKYSVDYSSKIERYIQQNNYLAALTYTYKQNILYNSTEVFAPLAAQLADTLFFINQNCTQIDSICHSALIECAVNTATLIKTL
jgi:hypothetical protein